MKHPMRKLFCVLLTLCLLFGFASCGGGEEEEVYQAVDHDPVHTSADRLITFVSSDSGLDSFLNEFRERHMRYNDNRIHTHPVGAGQTAWKEWESMIGSWWDASAANGTMDSFYATKDWVTDWLLSPVQDNQGYIWADNGSSLDSWGMGWQFPNAQENGGAVYDFESSAQGFTVSGEGVSASAENSRLNVTAANASEIVITSPELSVNPLLAPFLVLNFYYAPSAGEVEDIYVYFKTENDADWTEENKVSFSQHSTTGSQIGASAVSSGSYYFPMYLSENWGWGTRLPFITQLKIVVKGSGSFSGVFSMDYLSTDFDDRQALNPCNYILAAWNVASCAQDAGLLEHLLPYARKAMNFLYHQLEGSEGLISTAYFMGHDNTGVKSVGTGIGDGYWDVLAFPNVNIYANLSWYNAIQAMAGLERMAEYYEVETDPVTTVNADMNGTLTYDLTAEDLDELADLCRTRFQSEFWNQSTGRFHAGTRSDGSIQDHGYVMFNEQALAAGLATEEQAESVMAWINGERTVSGDESTGEDIYRYEFAPRFNTDDILTDFYWGYSANFNGNVQNGGTALHLTYYDLAAQAVVSPQGAFDRLKDIQTWYEKVKAAGGEGQNFYRAYYDQQLIGVEGGGSSGVIGVDYEFLEAALLLSAMPDVFFGLSAGWDGTLTVEPLSFEGLDWWTMENLTFGGNYYDLTISKYFIQISSVTAMPSGSAASGTTAELRLREPGFDYKVLVNGAEVTDYTVSGGRIVVRTSFGNVKAEVVPK